MTREGSTQDWLDKMPVNLTGLYEVMLQRSEQGLRPESLPALRTIISWLVNCFLPLPLDWLDCLVTSKKALSGVDVLSFALQFFEVVSTSNDTASVPAIDATALFEESTDVSTESSSSKAGLRLQMKNRVTQTFFNNADSIEVLRPSFSSAHRIIFLDTVNIILQRKTDNKAMYYYSVEHSLLHWNKIVPEEHTPEEQAEVCHAFAVLIRDCRYAEGLVGHQTLPVTPGRILAPDWEDRWKDWSDHALKLSMDSDISDYWRDPKIAMHPLLTAFVRYWLQSVDAKKVYKAWWWANQTEEWVRSSEVWGKPPVDERYYAYLSPSGWWDADELLIRLADILSTELDSQAHFAVALLLQQIDEPSGAFDEFKLALMSCQDTVSRSRCYVKLASFCVARKEWSDALDYCKFALDVEQTTTQLGVSSTGSDVHGINAASDSMTQEISIRGNTITDENIGMQQSILHAEALRAQGTALMGLDRETEAANSFYEARQLSTEVVPVQDLLKELLCLQENPVSMIDRLLSFSSIDRLHFLTSDSLVLAQEVSIIPTRIILPAIIKSQRKDEVIKTYRELIRALDTEQAGAPIRIDLARILWRLRHDVGDVKLLLNQVLDGISEERRYALTEREPVDVAQSALWLMTDVLLDEFRSSKSIEDKRRILSEARELPRRSFLASQPLITDLVWNPYDIAIAYMLRKIGPMSEYQHIMHTIFEKAVGGLDDKTNINDVIYLTSLSRVFMMISSLRKVGERIYPSEEDKQDEEGMIDLGYSNSCHGICLPVVTFDDPEQIHHKCLICMDSKLCESCYKTRMQWNANPTTIPSTDPEFCCANGQYLQLPREDEVVVQGGKVYIYDEDWDEKNSPGAVDVELEDDGGRDVRTLWQKAWEDLAFGL